MKMLPKRSEVQAGDTWDLASLFANDVEWEQALSAWEKRIPEFDAFAGTLGSSAERLAECLAFDLEIDRAADRLGTYAHLRASEDTAAAAAQRMMGLFQHAATRAGERASFIQPEIMAIPAEVLSGWLELLCLSLIGSCSIGSCGIVPMSSRSLKKNCWPCRARLPGQPVRFFAS